MDPTREDTPPAPSAESLAAAATAARAGGRRKGPAPVDLWNPPFCGDLDIEIRADGSWFYLGTPIGRPALVELFGSILKREGEDYFLVTPAEKIGIRVADVPFVAVDSEAEGAGDAQRLSFVTNLGDRVTAGPSHPIRMARDEDGAPRPYVHIRGGLEARIDRKTFYRLVDLGSIARHDGAEWFGLWSGGAFFPFSPAAELS